MVNSGTTFEPVFTGTLVQQGTQQVERLAVLVAVIVVVIVVVIL